jgi:hypothetical protein
MALEALADEPPSPEAVAAEVIEAECPNCMELVQFPADKAGKQAQCPSCRRIVRVPMPKADKPQDWRGSTNRPSLAKPQYEENLAGAWDPGRAVVGRESLEEAGVIVDRKPPTLLQKPQTWLTLLGVAAVVGLGTWLYLRRERTIQVREDYVQKALNLLTPTGELAPPPLVIAEAHRGAAEFFMRQDPPKPGDARLRLESARTAAIQAPPGPDGGLDRLLMLSEVALTQADLTGTAEQESAGDWLPWEKVMTELRKTLEPVKQAEGPLHGGVVLLQERLGRRLGLRGGADRPMILALPQFMYASPADHAEGKAELGLTFLAFDQKEKATEQANQARQLLTGSAQKQPPGKVVALFVALGQEGTFPDVRRPGGGEPPLNARLGYAEGLAHKGDLDGARQAANAPGRFEDRFLALVRVAWVAAAKDPNSPDIQAAVDLLDRELGNRDLPDWPLIRLAILCARSSSDAGKRLVEVLSRLQNPSPRNQSIRAWVVAEVLRSPLAGVAATEDTAKAVASDSALGSALAWEALARRTAAQMSDPSAVIETWPAKARPAAYVGAALGLQDQSR